MRYLLSATFPMIFLMVSAPSLAADKAGYSLFNPTPPAQLRELSTDRPDKTESPYTVDAGHYQIEMDIVSYTHDHDKSGGANTVANGYGVGVTNFKMGLSQSTDLQFVVESYLYADVKDKLTGAKADASGFGDVTVRLKHNIFGNDGGDSAFAVMPFVKLPTNTDNLGNNDVEGGLIVPYGFALTDSIGMGVMTQINANKDTDDSGYHAEFVNSVTVSTGLTDALSAYAEFFTSRATESDRHWENTLDFGVTYGVGDNLQFDAGINIGVTDAADDYNPFVGVSYRW